MPTKQANVPFLTTLEKRTKMNEILTYGVRTHFFNLVIDALIAEVENAPAKRNNLLGSIQTDQIKIIFKY